MKMNVEVKTKEQIFMDKLKELHIGADFKAKEKICKVMLGIKDFSSANKIALMNVVYDKKISMTQLARIWGAKYNKRITLLWKCMRISSIVIPESFAQWGCTLDMYLEMQNVLAKKKLEAKKVEAKKLMYAQQYKMQLQKCELEMLKLEHTCWNPIVNISNLNFNDLPADTQFQIHLLEKKEDRDKVIKTSLVNLKVKRLEELNLKKRDGYAARYRPNINKINRDLKAISQKLDPEIGLAKKKKPVKQ